ncbi:Tc toxin subunit A [Pseudomonas farris]
MDVSNDSLLDKLVDFPASEEGTKTDFKTAMQTMKIESVFDIAHMTQEQFARELARHSDANAQQAYDNAVSYARQISRLYLEHQVSSGDAKRRVRRNADSESKSVPATYQTLFNENWEHFCHEGDIASIDSPVAYLRALYLFAGQLENSSQQPEQILLEKRRPDLKALMLDHQSAFVPRPMLNIVNDTLSSQIQNHLKDTNNSKSVHEVLASEHYPFSLPYDLHHQQCLLGLGADKPGLGELNYRVSLKLPFSQVEKDLKSRVNAQRHLSGLSPEQQRLLITKLDTDANVDTLKKAYGIENTERLGELEFFKERTGVTTEQLQQVLAQGKHSPRASANSPPSAHANYGASYVNGPISEQKSKGVLKIAITENKTKEITNRSRTRFHRLQQMIRLQRWTGIPFAELDTLIVNAVHSEGGKSMTLNTNTLRTLGVYRYLNQRHGILPEEFASFLHDMPTSACGDRTPLFDQVFNRTGLLDSPLQKKQTAALVTTDLETFSYLSAGLGLSFTQDSLLLLAQQTEKYASLKHDLSSVSSLYRQARIARMFGLSPADSTSLARLLGGDKFSELLVTGALSNPSEPTTDILDVLMAMDWAVDWLRQSNFDVPQLTRQFDAKNDLPLSQNLEKRLETIRADENPPFDQQRQVESLLHDIADVSADYVPCVMKLAGTSTTMFFADIKNLHPGTMPRTLAKVLAAVEACKGLHLNSSTLQALMNNTTWLAPDNSGTLTPQTLYLLERFSHCARRQTNSEESLLHYLHLANQSVPQNLSNSANQLLADLLNWKIDEVNCLTQSLPHKRAQSMEAVDWIMRCQACCESTGLSADLLLKATALTSDSMASEWKTVGEALIAARH